jgi:hypothetical protein
VQICPQCGTPIQTLDLPCPVCASHEQERDELRHGFSKTFEIRTAYSYKPETLVQNVNAFLWQQHTVDRLSANLHLDRQALVRGVTLHCVAGIQPVYAAFQFTRIRLAEGYLLPRKRRDVGTALNDWAESHPSFRRVNHWVISSNGRPVEVWLLYVTPRALPIDSNDPLAPSPTP